MLFRLLLLAVTALGTSHHRVDYDECGFINMLLKMNKKKKTYSKSSNRDFPKDPNDENAGEDVALKKARCDCMDFCLVTGPMNTYAILRSTEDKYKCQCYTGSVSKIKKRDNVYAWALDPNVIHEIAEARGKKMSQWTRPPTEPTRNMTSSAPTAVIMTTYAPTDDPTDAPTDEPTKRPFPTPTEEPTHEPTKRPFPAPTEEPTEPPTEEPTGEPTDAPIYEGPTGAPTHEPTRRPFPQPTEEPTDAAIPMPTDAPTTTMPTPSSTPNPVPKPAPRPRPNPTPRPTPTPTNAPRPPRGGDGWLELGNWRVGQVDDASDGYSHFSFCSRFGNQRTAAIFRSDGTQHFGPRNDYCNWDKNYGSGYKPVNVYFGHNFIQFKDWRIGEYGSHASLAYIPTDPRAKGDAHTAVIWRNDKTQHVGPRKDYNSFDFTNMNNNIMWGDRFVQFGNWKMGESDKANERITHFSIASGRGSSVIYRGDGLQFDGNDHYHMDGRVTMGTVPQQQPYWLSGVMGGHRFIQLGSWRFGAYNDNHFSFCYQHGDKRTVQLFTSDGTIHGGNRNDWNLWDRESGPNNRAVDVVFGNQFIQFGSAWRLGNVDGSHMSISHKNGKTAMIWRSDGSRHGGPRNDFSTWDRDFNPPNVMYGDSIIGIGSWRLAEINTNHMSIYHQDSAKTAVIYRSDGTSHSGPRGDYQARGRRIYNCRGALFC